MTLKYLKDYIFIKFDVITVIENVIFKKGGLYIKYL